MPRGRPRGSTNRRSELIERLFAESRDPTFLADRDGRLVLVNPAWAETVGMAQDALVGRRFADFVHPDDLQAGALSGAGAVEECELRLRRADGGFDWFTARIQRLADGAWLTTLRDAAEARALEELRRSRTSLCASAGVGTWTYAPGENRARWSEDLLQRVGLESAALATADDYARLIPAADRRRLARAFETALATGGAGQLEHRVRTPRGHATFRVTYRAEPAADGGHVLNGIAEDITELAATRDAARREERRMREARREALVNGHRLKLALEVAQAGVYEIDHVAQSFWASPEFERLAGPAGDNCYLAVAELRYPRFHPDDLDHVRECFRALHHGEAASGDGFEARILDAAGEPRWVRIFHHLQVARNGRWLKAVGLLHDIDADKRQELALIEAQRAAQAAAEAKSNFLANISHEIRTPMNGVLGVLHLLKTEALSADGRMLLDEALSCGQMLAELLNDVIDVSKIEAGRFELESAPVDPAAMVDGVLRLLRPQADAKALRLTVDGDAKVGWIRADPVRLRQALFNLIGNAVKFTERGGVAVRFARAPDGRLRFEVEDTGVGVPAAAQAHIFDRFNQGDASTTRRFGGSGLGLTITRKLARAMGGDVGFTSVEGQGSTFWLEIAAAPADAQAAQEAPAGAVLSDLRILVVEDNPTNRIIATKLLEQLGASVETAADGFLGVEAAARGGFDLILMDVQMPGIDGLEAARRIRALSAPMGETPIVALTANVLSHQSQAYLAAGMNGVVGKPISPAALLQEIARLGEAEETVPQSAVA
jgi:PAS domain S-box-containing protein